jgi:hypothetical protein
MTMPAFMPVEVDDVSIAFGGGGDLAKMMPKVPENYPDRQKWERFQNDWFYHGLKSTAGLVAREGVDKDKAIRHLKTIQGSFEPKHEHKEAAVAYLASLWFEPSSTWERAR